MRPFPTVADKDIAFAESLMKVTFNDEQRDVLRCMGSRDVVACPGSGKTTTLVAKLAILAQKGIRGLCVLSHTNVARSEVETKLGKWASVVCQYPNYVGTIQSFVDRFLCIPAMSTKYGFRPWAIDDDSFGRLAARKFYDLPFGTRSYLDRKNQGDGKAVVRKLRFNWEGGPHVYLEGDDITRFGAVTTDTYKYLHALKLETLKEGCLAYRDAFGVAKWYIATYPDQIALFSKRFPLVFIDEMQDTDPLQNQILDSVFSGSCVQKFGDPNQAIYQSISESATSAGWLKNSCTQLTITHSSRLSTSIAELSRNVCLNPLDLKGNPGRPSRPHTIFLFASSAVGSVLPAFGDLISGIEDFDLIKGRFAALGAIRRVPENPEHLALPSYWEAFNPTVGSTTAPRNCLLEYFQSAAAVLDRAGDCGKARSELLAGILKIVRLEDVRNQTTKRPFTETTLLNTIRELHPELFLWLRSYLREAVNRLAGGVFPDSAELQEVARRIVLPIGTTQKLSQGTLEFVSRVPTGSDVGRPSSSARNVFRRESQRGTVEIDVKTIHSAKGETHQATLLLETFFHTYDLKTLVPYLLGQRPSPKPMMSKFLPLAYVGMTRPTDLLCLAMRTDHVTKAQRKDLASLGWALVDL